MGRSSQQHAAENRLKILDGAIALFRQHGIDNVSVATLMEAVGMTVGGFYKHFESKDALVAEALELAFERSLASWEQVYQHAQAKARPASAEMVRQYLRNRAPKRRCAMLAFAPHVTTGEAGADSVAAYQAGVKNLFERFVEGAGGSAEAAGDAPAVDPQAMVLFAAMVGASVISQAIGSAHWVRAIEAAVNQAAVQLTDQLAGQLHA